MGNSNDLCGRTCTICHQRITKLSDLELDHTKPFSKGGKKLVLAHRDCNRMKASGSLRKIQKTLGIKTKKRRRTKKRKRKAKPRGPYWVDPLIGKKRPSGLKGGSKCGKKEGSKNIPWNDKGRFYRRWQEGYWYCFTSRFLWEKEKKKVRVRVFS